MRLLGSKYAKMRLRTPLEELTALPPRDHYSWIWEGRFAAGRGMGGQEREGKRREGKGREEE